MCGGEKIGKDLPGFGNNPPEQSAYGSAQDLPDVATEEVKKDVKTRPSSADLNKDTTNQ